MRILLLLALTVFVFPSTALAVTSDVNIAQTYEGYTLITPSTGGNGADGKNEIYLVDMDGNIVHSWKLTTSETQFSELMPTGTLLAILGGASRPESRTRGQAEARLVEIDWDGNITWEYQNTNLHHDFAMLANGNIIGLVREPLRDELRSRISDDSLPSSVWVDRLIEIDHNTKEIVWEWSEQDELDLSRYPYHGSGEIFHTNAVEYIPAGNAFNGKESLFISSREQNMIMIIDKASGDIVWEFSNNVLESQHDATLLDNGHVLVFNNRPTKKTSQVLEIDPKTNKVLWTYEASGFFAEKISGAQRLKNGNTLITEGVTGQIFEVTPAKEIVWEYQVGGDEKKDHSVFRSYRYGPDEINWPNSFLPNPELLFDEPYPYSWKQSLFLIVGSAMALASIIGGIVLIRRRMSK
ncbi:MAG: arylsulfotransferase family protein [Patescibacteria group bacterium]|jgi:outer membrane protein assembly factor BamB